jgi:hypothetical protein
LLGDREGFVALLGSYFDASTRDDGMFCVGGFLFDKNGAHKYALRARRVFGPYGLLHMKELVHRVGRYEGISGEERDRLVKSAVDLAREHTLAGFAVSCWEHEIKEFSSNDAIGYRDAYSFCVQFAARGVGTWLRSRWPSGSGNVAYVFETGDQNSAEAATAISKRGLRSTYKYGSHAFRPKEDEPALWLGDFLAWEWAKYRSETVGQAKRPMRGSLRALLLDGFLPTPGRMRRYLLWHFEGPRLARFLKYVTDIQRATTIEEMDALYAELGITEAAEEEIMLELTDGQE